MNASVATPDGATAVITHRVREGKESQYDEWLNEITPLCRSFPGHLDWHMIRPIVGLTTTYTIVIRFDTIEHLRQWMDSRDRQRLIEKVRPLLAADDNYAIGSGLDFWFAKPHLGMRVPVRWKQFLITWSAIYALVLGMPLVLDPVLQWLSVPNNPVLKTLLATLIDVFLMVYVVMPSYTRLVRRWLYL